MHVQNPTWTSRSSLICVVNLSLTHVVCTSLFSYFNCNSSHSHDHHQDFHEFSQLDTCIIHMQSGPEVQMHFFNSSILHAKKSSLSRLFFLYFANVFVFGPKCCCVCMYAFYTRREQNFSIELEEIAQYGITMNVLLKHFPSKINVELCQIGQRKTVTCENASFWGERDTKKVFALIGFTKIKL